MALTNRYIADLFDTIADMLEIKGEIIHRVMAYRNAAAAIREFPRSLHALAQEGALETIPSVGKIIAEKITELLETGKLEFHERLSEEIPQGVVEILRIDGVGPKKAKLFWQEAGITSVEALEAAARSGTLRKLPGMGVKSEAKILEGIESYKRRRDDRRVLLGQALPFAERILEYLLTQEEVGKAAIVGSIRRGCPTVSDIDLLMTSTAPLQVIDALAKLDFVVDVPKESPRATNFFLHNGMQVQLRVVPETSWGTALHFYTGSEYYIHSLSQHYASEHDLIFNLHELGELAEDKELPARAFHFTNEEALYEHLGLPWIPPELREGFDVIECARAGMLPKLIELSDIRADLHMHTTWSDGKATAREMAEAARARGRTHIVITDHSQSATIANGLSVERLMAQHEEIRRLDAEMRPFRVFHGTELEIRADGRLDYPDEILQKLDFVVASLHVGLRQPREQVTARLLNAIRNPHVDLIGHPRGQLLLNRDGADLDMDAVFAAARETGTLLEINANPERLDLEAQYARHAVEMGITLAIDTDAHSVDEMDFMRYGVITARRGWVKASDVINTWDVETFIRWINARGEAHHD